MIKDLWYNMLRRSKDIRSSARPSWRLSALWFMFSILVSSAPAAARDAAEIRHGALLIAQPWTRATPPGAQVGGAYLTITNTGDKPDRLLAVATLRAEKAEIHEVKMDGGVMTMRPLGEGLVVPPGETVELKPGGIHLMLMKLDGRIEKGTSVSIKLTFERSGAITLDFVAAPIGARKPVVSPAGEGG